MDNWVDWLASFMGAAWYWWVAGILFVFYYGIEVMLNGGSSLLSILNSLWNDFLWSIPGGRRRRGAFIKARMGESERGSMGSWSYQEIREQNLYEEVGSAMLPGPLTFYGRFIAFAFWPLSLIVFAVVLILDPFITPEDRKT